MPPSVPQDGPEGRAEERAASALATIRRGLRRRCPRCGEGPLFLAWNRLRDSCPVCGLPFEQHTGDTWFFMYMSTAGLTGFLVVCMVLVWWIFKTGYRLKN